MLPPPQSHIAALLHRYAAELCSFQLGAEIAPPMASDPLSLARRAARLMARTGRSRCLLLGLDPAVAAALRQETGVAPLVAESSPALARALAATLQRDQPGATLAMDASPLALLLLVLAAGWRPDDPAWHVALVRPDPALQRLHRWLRLVAALDLPAAEAAPSLSLLAILHPDEPDLPAFFAQLPPWLEEATLVWDAAAPPSSRVLSLLPPGLPPRFRMTQLAQPLAAHGFAAQRNLALANCRSRWALFLDADERLSPEAWAMLPRLMAMPDLDRWWLPRETCHPDREHALVGHGLWPDPQPRLLRMAASPRFTGTLHERLDGPARGEALACHLAIRHEQRLAKNRALLEEKLRRFEVLGGVRHVLSDAYPIFPRRDLATLAQGCPPALRLDRLHDPEA